MGHKEKEWMWTYGTLKLGSVKGGGEEEEGRLGRSRVGEREVGMAGRGRGEEG